MYKKVAGMSGDTLGVLVPKSLRINVGKENPRKTKKKRPQYLLGKVSTGKIKVKYLSFIEPKDVTLGNFGSVQIGGRKEKYEERRRNSL